MNSHFRANSDVPKEGQGTTYERTTSKKFIKEFIKEFIRLDNRWMVSRLVEVARLYRPDAHERARYMNRIH